MAVRIKIKEARIDEMAQIGITRGLEIRVWTNDPGNIPHVHVRDSATGGKKLDACVRLDKAAYFKHGPHQDELNVSQRKTFDAFMRKPLKDDPFPNNYEYAVYEWNRNNSKAKISIEKDADGLMPIPDYTQIAEK